MKKNLFIIISDTIRQLEFSKFVVVGIIRTLINYVIFIQLLLKLNFVYFIAGAIGLYKYFNVQLFYLVAHVTKQIGVT